MKSIKKMFNLVLGVLIGFGAASCSDTVEYTPAQAQGGAQVYFPTTNAASFDVVEENGVLDLVIARADKGAELNVPLHVEGEAAGFTFPASVTFPAGVDSANVSVSYTGLAYDTPAEFTLSIDSVNATPYGISSYTFTVNRPAPWKSLGMCTYTDDFVTTFFSVGNVPYEVEIQENELQPGFYRLVNPYGAAYGYNEPGDYDDTQDYYMYIHAEDPDKVYTETFFSGMNWGYGEFIFASLAGYYIERGKPENAEGNYGTFKNGEITFPEKSMLIAMAEYNDGGLYTANSKGAFSILMPGVVKADYSVDVNYAGIFTDPQGVVSAVAYLTTGGDVKANAKAVVMPQDVDAAAVADAIAAGEIEAVDVAAGRVEIPFDAEEMGSSDLQIIVVVVVDGEAKSVANSNFEYYGGGSKNPWNSIGTGYYTDDMLITSFFNVPAPTYEVEIMEHSEKPGLYRLVDPYAEGVFYYSSSDMGKNLAPAGNYLEVNATNPNMVYVPTQSLKVDWGYGEISICSAGWDYWQYYGDDYLDLLIDRGFFGVLKNGIIAMPVIEGEDEDGEAYAFQGSIIMGQNAYDAGAGEWKIVLPSAAKSVKAQMAARAKATRSALQAKKLGKQSRGVDVKKILLTSAKRFK